MLAHHLAAIVKANYRDLPTHICVITASLMITVMRAESYNFWADQAWRYFEGAHDTFVRAAQGDLDAMVDLELLPESSRPEQGLAPEVSRG